MFNFNIKDFFEITEDNTSIKGLFLLLSGMGAGASLVYVLITETTMSKDISEITFIIFSIMLFTVGFAGGALTAKIITESIKYICAAIKENRKRKKTKAEEDKALKDKAQKEQKNIENFVKSLPLRREDELTILYEMAILDTIRKDDDNQIIDSLLKQQVISRSFSLNDFESTYEFKTKDFKEVTLMFCRKMGKDLIANEECKYGPKIWNAIESFQYNFDSHIDQETASIINNSKIFKAHFNENPAYMLDPTVYEYLKDKDKKGYTALTFSKYSKLTRTPAEE
ncbi:MAG: hypothetical protein CMI02_03095 [Oceanospirillaceae bacterium]|nr:hypothetical protein [Oceanospirillaceae bacterium]